MLFESLEMTTFCKLQINFSRRIVPLRRGKEQKKGREVKLLALLLPNSLINELA